MSTINAPRIAINEKTCIAICEPTLCFMPAATVVKPAPASFPKMYSS